MKRHTREEARPLYRKPWSGLLIVAMRVVRADEGCAAR